MEIIQNKGQAGDRGVWMVEGGRDDHCRAEIDQRCSYRTGLQRRGWFEEEGGVGGKVCTQCFQGVCILEQEQEGGRVRSGGSGGRVKSSCIAFEALLEQPWILEQKIQGGARR